MSIGNTGKKTPDLNAFLRVANEKPDGFLKVKSDGEVKVAKYNLIGNLKLTGKDNRNARTAFCEALKQRYPHSVAMFENELMSKPKVPLSCRKVSDAIGMIEIVSPYESDRDPNVDLLNDCAPPNYIPDGPPEEKNAQSESIEYNFPGQTPEVKGPITGALFGNEHNYNNNDGLTSESDASYHFTGQIRPLKETIEKNRHEDKNNYNNINNNNDSSIYGNKALNRPKRDFFPRETSGSEEERNPEYHVSDQAKFFDPLSRKHSDAINNPTAEAVGFFNRMFKAPVDIPELSDLQLNNLQSIIEMVEERCASLTKPEQARVVETAFLVMDGKDATHPTEISDKVIASVQTLEPIQKAWIHEQTLARVSLLSMRRIIARRMKPAALVA